MTNHRLSPQPAAQSAPALLSDAPAPLLKQMARLWGGKGTEKKADCIATIHEGLADPARVRAALIGLEPEARAALALLKEHGGALSAGALELALRTCGYGLPEPIIAPFGYHPHPVSAFAGDLVQRGFLQLGPYEGYGTSYQALEHDRGVGGSATLHADERLLRGVDWPVEVRALEIAPVSPRPVGGVHRSAQHVLLDLMAVPEAIASMQRLGLTKAGEIRVADLRQLAKRLGWEGKQDFDGCPFPHLPQAIISALSRAGWLRLGRSGLVLSGKVSQLEAQPLPQRVRDLADAFLTIGDWEELPHGGWPDEGAITGMRWCLFHALRALPADGEFRRLVAFVAVLYDRVGELVRTAYDYQNRKPSPNNQPDADFQQALAAWREKHRAAWIKHEQPFIKAVLTSWMYWLGLVEIGNRDSADFCFRLTDLGRAVLWGAPEADAPSETADGPAWVVQPNYDLIVYLERARPADLAFLERHAERRQSEPHILHYQLTRESVYRGLESGTTVQQVLDTLRQGAGMDLPQNVEREIREWGEQRERVTIRRKATLIAFPDPETRARAVQAGLPGRPVGDRYVLTAPRARIKPALHAVYGPLTLPSLDYADPLPPCLRAQEDGTLKLVRDTGDLLLSGQLANCAEPVDATHWRITPASLAKVRQAGVPAATLLDFLRERAVEELPPLLEMAIRNALGSRSAVQAESGLVLRVTDKALYTALTTSPTLQPLLLDVPGPDTLVISREHEQEFRAHLEWLGVRLTDYKRATDRPDWLQTVKDARSQKRRHRRYY